MPPSSNSLGALQGGESRHARAREAADGGPAAAVVVAVVDAAAPPACEGAAARGLTMLTCVLLVAAGIAVGAWAAANGVR